VPDVIANAIAKGVIVIASGPNPTTRDLADVDGRLVVTVPGPPSLAGDRQHAVLQLDVDERGVEPGREGVDLDRARRGADVQGRVSATRAAADIGIDVESRLQLVLQPVKLREHVAGKQGPVH